MADTIASQEATAQHEDLVEAAGMPVGGGEVRPGYDPRLTNEDLAPLRRQTWGAYNIFAFWMSDVHSVGGYVTAGSLFALGLSSWQVLVALVVGISIVYFFCNLVARPSQATGVPYPVINRVAFGVLGANVPAIIRGSIAVAWYGIQTYLASAALDVVVLKLWPGLAAYADVDTWGFLGLPLLGWCSYALLWVLQAAVFWTGMETIRRFIDFTMARDGKYWYRKGYNPPAIIATAVGAVVAVVPVLWAHGPGMHTTAQYSWFIGMALGLVTYLALTRRTAAS